MKRILLCIPLALLFSGCTEQAEMEPESSSQQSTMEDPGDEEVIQESMPEEEPASSNLEIDTPKNHSVDSAMLDALHAAVAETEEPKSGPSSRSGTG